MMAAVALAASLCGCGRLDRDAVRTEVDKIQSASGEGMLVAREAARGRAFDAFIEIRAAELQSEVEKADQKLSSTPAEDGWSEQAKRAVGLGGQVRSNLEQLHEHPGDRTSAARLARNLQALWSRVGEVANAL
jgi:hypothetical protein